MWSSCVVWLCVCVLVCVYKIHSCSLHQLHRRQHHHQQRAFTVVLWGRKAAPTMMMMIFIPIYFTHKEIYTFAAWSLLCPAVALVCALSIPSSSQYAHSQPSSTTTLSSSTASRRIIECIFPLHNHHQCALFQRHQEHTKVQSGFGKLIVMIMTSMTVW